MAGRLRRAQEAWLPRDGCAEPDYVLADDVAVTKRALAAQDGPSVLVGHSYGGVVSTEAGNDPQVAGLVYVAAFAPDAGESVAALIKDPPLGAAVPPILPPLDGFLFLEKSKFAESFAADVAPNAAAFMADSQVPWGGGRAHGRREQGGAEDEAKHVHRGDRGPHDPSAGTARDGCTRSPRRSSRPPTRSHASRSSDGWCEPWSSRQPSFVPGVASAQ